MGSNYKNLSYDSTEPAFLRRLKGQFNSGELQRQERSQARPKRLRDDDEDDEPTYVDEESNQTLSKADVEALKTGDKAQAGTSEHEGLNKASALDTLPLKNGPAEEETQNSTVTLSTQDATIGAKKKSRAIKKFEEDEADGSSKSDAARSDGITKSKRKSKKAKKVKLSFADDGGDDVP